MRAYDSVTNFVARSSIRSDDALCDRLKCDPDGIPSLEFIFRRSEDWWLCRCCAQHECFLVDACIPALIEAANRNPNESNVIFDVTKALGRSMAILKDGNCTLSRSVEAAILDFVCRFWDSMVEFVCHECVYIFDVLIHLHSLGCKCKTERRGDGCCSWILEVANSLTDGTPSCRSKLKCLLIFVKQYPLVIDRFPDETITSFYKSLSCATLAVAASHLIVYDLSRLFTDACRLSLHTSLLRNALCSPNQQLWAGAREKLIPILFKDKHLAGWLAEDFTATLSASVCFAIMLIVIPPTVIDDKNGEMFGIRSALCQGFSDDRTLDVMLFLSRLCIFHQTVTGGYSTWDDFIDERYLIRALLHSHSQMRLSAWNLISDHPRLTVPIRRREVELMKAFMLTNMTEQCPAIRQKILTGLKKIFIRVRETSQMLLKAGNDEEDLVNCYVNFVLWLRDLCFESLQKGSNFNRRIMALHIIDYIYQKPFLRADSKGLFYQSIASRLRLERDHHLKLLNCLDDSYQLCQEVALDLLTSNCCADLIDWDTFLEESICRMLSTRSHNVMSSSYRFRYFLRKNSSRIESFFEYLLDLCSARIRLIIGNLLAVATEGGSLYPILNAIAVVIEQVEWENLSVEEVEWWHSHVSAQLLPLCFEVGELVAPVVHSMSPEGFAPDALLHSNESIHNGMASLTETSQLLLVGCWRAHRHISTILHLIASKVPYPLLISDAELRRIGEYYWLQLTECKHCGAFELAVEGFEGLCRRLWNLMDTHRDDHECTLPTPDGWLDDILAAIKGEVDTSKLCSTRRSAGLPHLVCAILGTEPRQRNAHCVRKALDSLLSYEHLSPELQVHSINVLRSIFSDKRLSEAVQGRLERALRACLLGIASPFWPLRNAISQLFAALLVRIFGVAKTPQRTLRVHEKNAMSGYEFFSRFPSLYDMIYLRLLAFADMNNQLGVYPVLALLTHLFPSTQRSREHPISVFILPTLRVLLDCRAQKIRELAAHALIAICDEQDVGFLLRWIRSLELLKARQNHVHCILLILQVVNERFEDNPFQCDVKRIVDEIIEKKLFRSWCDCNLSILAALIHSCGVRPKLYHIKLLIDSDATRWLTARPVAALMARFLLENATGDVEEGMIAAVELLQRKRNLRSELWRAFLKKTHVGISSLLLRMAAADLCESDEYTVCNILRLLLDNVAMVLGNEECVKLVNAYIEKLTDGSFHLGREISKDLIHLLSMELHLTCFDVRWILSCAQSESVHSKRIALRGILWARENCIKAIEVLNAGAVLLQDEESSIREESASILSGVLHSGKGYSLLNAQIV
uniref:DUF2428 domain-containing protein n=2 Tax=Parascaris univalens TaxID=6257 RepID=A0A915ACR8_PARUN